MISNSWNIPEEKKPINWGEPNSALRMMMISGLVAELKQHLDPFDVERDRQAFIEANATRLDGLEALLKTWKRRAAR